MEFGQDLARKAVFRPRFPALRIYFRPESASLAYGTFFETQSGWIGEPPPTADGASAPRTTRRRTWGFTSLNNHSLFTSVPDLSGLGAVIRLKADLLRKFATTQPPIWPEHMIRFVAELERSGLMDTTALLVLLTELREELRLLLGAEQADGDPTSPKPVLELRPGLLRNEMLLRFRQDILDVVLPLARRRRPRSPIAVETKRIIDERYTEPLTLDLLAAEVGRSKRHLASVFLRDFRVSVHAYLTKVRLNQALALIRAGEKIEVVSLLVGYRSKKNFYRNFNAHIGVTPIAYRVTLSGIHEPPTA